MNSPMTSSDSILINDFSRLPTVLIEAQSRAIHEVIDSGSYILSDKVRSFERSWATSVEAIGCVGTANGLDAIEIGLRVLGVGAGDEVITPSLTAFPTVLAILRTGATPVFADIDPLTACISPASVSNCFTSRTKALVVVHLYGRSAPLEELRDLCNEHNVFLVEDCAQAHLAKSNTHPVGTYGKFAAWSFYPTKNLGAIGDAGAVTSMDPEFLSRVRIFRNYGQTDRYTHQIQGSNSRLDELQAAVLLERLKYLEEWTTKRRYIAQRYSAQLSNPYISTLPLPSSSLDHVHHLYIIKTSYRDSLQAYLSQNGIQTLIHYPIPCHKQAAVKQPRLASSGLVHTLDHCNTCLSLPVHPFLCDSEVDKVINIVNRFQPSN